MGIKVMGSKSTPNLDHLMAKPIYSTGKLRHSLEKF